MKDCIITIRKKDGTIVGTFTSSEFDKYILENRDKLLEEESLQISGDELLSKIFSKNITSELGTTEEQKKSLKILTNIQEYYNEHAKILRNSGEKTRTIYYDDGSYETEELGEIYQVKNGIPVTKLSEQFGGSKDILKPLNAPFDKLSWRSKLSETDERVKNATGDTKEEILNNIEEQGSKVSSKVGTETHAVIGTVIDNTNPLLNEKIPIPKTPNLNKLHLQSDSKSTAGLNRELIAEKIGNDIVSKLKEKYGKDCIILSEVPIISNALDGTIAPSLKPVHSEDTKVEHVVGQIDILVIDNTGDFHVFDIKTSRKIPGNWTETNNEICREDNAWTSITKQNYEFQGAGYGAILTQWGGKVIDHTLIPIQMIFTEDVMGRIDEFSDMKMLDWVRIPGATFIKENNIADRVSRLIPSASFNEELQSLEKANQYIAELFPSVSKLRDANKMEKTIDYYINKRKGFIKSFNPTNDELKNKGYTRYFVREGLDDKRVYCTNDNEDLKKKLEKYVEERNAHDQKAFISLGNALYAASRNNNKEDAIKDLGEIIGGDSGKYVIAQFGKYVKQSWDFLKNDEYTNNGIFIFQKGGRIEVVIADPGYLTIFEQLEKGQTILGTFEPDSGEVSDTTVILSSEYGNLLLMKAAAIIACNHDDLLKRGAKISQVRAVNPFHGTEYNVLNSILVDNWNILASKYYSYTKTPMMTLDKNYFYDDFRACMDLANDVYFVHKEEFVNLFKLEIPQEEKDLTEKRLDNLIYYLVKTNRELLNIDENINRNTPIWQVYNQLLRAKLYLHGIHTVMEPDVGRFFDHYAPQGNWLTAPGESRSANVRMLDRITQMFHTAVNEKWTPLSIKWQRLLIEAYKEAGHSTWMGNERPLFREWLRRDPNTGEIDKRFLFREEGDPYWKTHKKAWEAASFFMRTVFNLKYGEATEQKLETNYEELFEVPLIEQAFFARIKEAGLKKMGIALKEWIQTSANLVSDTFAGKNNYKAEFENEHAGAIYSKSLSLTPSQREEMLQDKGIDYFEKDLDLVFGAAVYSGCESQVSRDYNVLWNGLYITLKMAVRNAERPGNKPVKMQNTLDFIEKYIKSRLYKESILPESEKPIAKSIAVLKTFVSHAALALKVSSMLKEGVQSGYTVLSRTIMQNVGKLNSPLKTEELMNAFNFLSRDCLNNFSKFTFSQQLSRRYSMANYSPAERSRANRVAFFGIGNFNSDIAFETSSVMDFFYRNAILLATMEHDGCKDAYYLVGEGENADLVYDMFKDKRFSAARLAKDGSLTWDMSDPNYNEQLEVYNYQVNQFIKEMRKIKDPKTGKERIIVPGDILPDAYTALQAAGIRNEAQRLLGFFDSDSKSLVAETLWGSLIFQFKTFLSAKFEQNFALSHKTNQLDWIQQYDENGNRLFIVVSNEEEFKEFGPVFWVSENSEQFNKLKSEGRKMDPYKIMAGRDIEGTLPQALAFTKAVINGDQDQLNEIWKDPIKRGRLYILLMDNFGMMVIAGLIKLLYGDDKVDDMKTQDWFTRWSYGILINSTKDGPIWQIMEGMVGDFKPPMISSLQRLVSTTGSVILGNKTFTEGVLDSFGATREMTSFINREL